MTWCGACAVVGDRPGRFLRAGPCGGACGKCEARTFGRGTRRGFVPPPSLQWVLLKSSGFRYCLFLKHGFPELNFFIVITLKRTL